MNNLISILIISALFSCTHKVCSQSSNTAKSQTDITSNKVFFRVYKIDSINNYYIIYVSKAGAMYKVISEKGEMLTGTKIQQNEDYDLHLVSILNKKNKIGNVEMMPSAHITCIGLDDSTKVCLEVGYTNDIYKAENLRGLCIISPQAKDN